MSWLSWSRRSRRWLLSECKKISFQRHWWSCARVYMIRPGIQGSSHNIDPSDSTVLQENVIFSKFTRKHNVKNINKNHKKNKTKLTALYWPPPAPPPPPRNKGLLLPDSGAVSRLLVMICFLIFIFSSSIAEWVSNGSWQPQTSLNKQVEGYLRSNKLSQITSNLLCTASNFLTNEQTSRRLFEN